MQFVIGKKRCKLASAIIITILFSSLICALENSTGLSKEEQEIEEALKLSEKDMEEMINAGFNVIRYNDTLMLAKQIYNAQLILVESGGEVDYFLIYKKIEELDEIKKSAFTASDELKAIEFTINQTKVNDLEAVLEIYNQAKEAFDSERYEESLVLIDKTYEKVSELEAFETKLKGFYDATSRGVVGFLKKRWKIILTIFIIISIITISTYNKVSIFLIQNKIQNMETRKKSLNRLTAKTQKDYFERGKFDEASYRTKSEKYAELIRDLNREIPLLKEELEIKKKKPKRGDTDGKKGKR